MCVNFGKFIDAMNVVDHCRKVFKFDHVTIIHPAPWKIIEVETRVAKSSNQNECWIKELPEAVKCEHVISVQWDGYIVNPEKWTDEFLEYDWIGAPWRLENLPNKNWRVGCGGFCLFSKRLSDIWSHFIEPHEAHDWSLGALYRDKFEAVGMKYAPIEVAAKFSKEMDLDDMEIPEGSTFGFHSFNYNQGERNAYKRLAYS